MQYSNTTGESLSVATPHCLLTGPAMCVCVCAQPPKGIEPILKLKIADLPTKESPLQTIRYISTRYKSMGGSWDMKLSHATGTPPC